MKKIYFILVMSVTSVIAFSQTRVTGGYEINIKDTPWQVLLKKMESFLVEEVFYQKDMS